MNATRRLFLSFALCVLATAVFAPRVAVAQSNDVTAQSLAKARETYERSMETIRGDIDKAIKAKQARASKPGKVDNDKDKHADGESDAFKASGDWPDVTNATALKNRAATAGNAMRDAYAAARAAYIKANKDALRDAVRDEADQFEKQSDIIPWKLNLIENLSIEDRTLAPGGKPLTLELPEMGEYRFEIRAKGSGEAGTLTVEVPLLDGKRLAIPALVGKDGNVRVLVTVREGFIGADLGVQRPVDLSKAASGASTTMDLRAEGGSFSVESVRVKAVVQGAREGTQDLARKPKDAPNQNDKPKDLLDYLPVGTKLDGRRTGTSGNPGFISITGEVTENNGKRVVIRINDNNSTIWDYAWELRGTARVELTGLVAEESTTLRTGPSGSGTVSDSGLSSSYEFKWSAGGIKNAKGSGRIELRIVK